MRNQPDHVQLGASDLRVYPFGLGTNTFNHPADPASYHAVLDGFVERGGNFLDTADMYSYWVPGNSGGESETVIGEWLTARRNRDEIVVATKVSGKPDLLGLAPVTIRQGIDESLTRLQTDYVDVYYAHYQDDSTPIVESAAAFDELVQAGKVRTIGLSNFTADAINEWFQVAKENGFALPVAFQPQYSLVARGYETELAETAREHGMAVFPFQVLAAGFLTGKYRKEEDLEGRARAGSVKGFLTQDGFAVIEALDEIAEAHETSVAAVAIAWAMADGKIAGPLAAATSPEQLDELFEGTSLQLTAEDVALLNGASAAFLTAQG